MATLKDMATENITDKVLKAFNEQYRDNNIRRHELGLLRRVTVIGKDGKELSESYIVTELGQARGLKLPTLSDLMPDRMKEGV